MSRKESKLYIINFIDPPDNSFKKQFNTTSNENAYSENCIKNISGKEGDVC